MTGAGEPLAIDRAALLRAARTVCLRGLPAWAVDAFLALDFDVQLLVAGVSAERPFLADEVARLRGWSPAGLAAHRRAAAAFILEHGRRLHRAADSVTSRALSTLERDQRVLARNTRNVATSIGQGEVALARPVESHREGVPHGRPGRSH